MITKDQIQVASMGLGSLSSQVGWLDIRVDRATPLGNPFEIPKNCPPEQLEKFRVSVILAFRRWLWNNLKLAQNHPDKRVALDEFEKAGYIIGKKFKNPTSGQVVGKLRELGGILLSGQKIRLLCWCAPLACHAEVIRNCLVKIENNPELRKLLIGYSAKN